MTESREATIKGLLAKAERTDNPHEAEAYSRKAEQLMIKWGIEEAQVRAKLGAEEKPEAIVTKYTAPFPKLFIKARQSIACGIVNGMGNMRPYVIGNLVAVVGFESDVDRALMLIPSLLIQADHAQVKWWKEFPLKRMLKSSEQFREKRMFLFGFRNEVERRLKEMYSEEVTAADASTPGTALVLVDRQKLVDEFFDAIPGMSKGRQLKGGGYGGGAAGRAAGAKANLGRTSLGGGSGRALGSGR